MTTLTTHHDPETVPTDDFDHVAKSPEHDVHPPQPTHESSAKPLTWSFGIYIAAMALLIAAVAIFGGMLL